MEFAEYVVSAYPVRDLLTENTQPKEEFLRRLFQYQATLQGSKTSYVYDFVKEDGSWIAGVFGSPRQITVNTGPENDWKPESVPQWEPFVLLFDRRQEPGGQRLLVECKAKSAQRAFVNSLEKYINANSNNGWQVSIDPILDRLLLDQVLEQYRGHVNRISFDFPKANLPTGINEALATVKKNLGNAGARLKADAISEEGSIDTSHEDIAPAFDEAEQSGARVAVYSEQETPGPGKRKYVKRYDSEQAKNTRTRRVDIEQGSALSAREKVSAVLSKLKR